MPITTCANLLWLTTHLRRRSMILNATASDAAASVYMSIGIMGRTRSTRAISEKRTGSNFSWSVEIKDTLELPQHSGVAASVIRQWARRAASQLANKSKRRHATRSFIGRQYHPSLLKRRAKCSRLGVGASSLVDAGAGRPLKFRKNSHNPKVGGSNPPPQPNLPFAFNGLSQSHELAR